MRVWDQLLLRMFPSVKQTMSETANLRREIDDLKRMVANPEHVDVILRSLGKQLLEDKPNLAYFGTKLVDYEMAILSIKALGYEMARQFAGKMLCRDVQEPPAILIPSKLCTQSDMESDWCIFWANEMKCAPIFH